MYTLQPIRTAAQRQALRGLYERAFPQNEKKPFVLIEDKAAKGSMEILCILSEAGDFCGLVITILHRDLMLLDYFAIAEDQRGNGIGSAVLLLLQERYPDRRLLLEIEDPQEVGAPNREERIRRSSFYHRNGWYPMPFTVSLFGVPMQILCPEKAVTFEEYHEIFVRVFSEQTAQKVFRLS